ncbi:hypothetical protein [Humisphaera borealis]|uniref:Uncharacterized protein n=1 Tax=Humisphaera borealis TaxID=2807512 RepID=A0A7M2WYB3_9BACT|nr:hypothetical protein [Humisphaera borealis]QOV89510.1 hypothetical protein IPV69_25505 [Humisphaera borealis]
MDPKNEFARGMVEALTQMPERTLDVLPYLTDPPPDMPLEPADERTGRLLQRKLPELRLDNIEFSDVVEYFKDVSGCDILPIWPAIERGGLKRNEKVSVRLYNVKFSKALTIVLDSISSPTCHLTYVIDDGIIVIGPRSDLIPRRAVSKFYDIRDLLTPQSDAALPVVVPSEVLPPAASAATTKPATQPDAIAVDGGVQSPTEAEVVKDLIALIRETVDPGSWKEEGGDFATIRSLFGQLVIRQTPEGHRDIERLLASLRSRRYLQVSTEVRILRCQEKTMEAVLAKWEKPAPKSKDPRSDPPWSGVPRSPSVPAGILLSVAQAAELQQSLTRLNPAMVAALPRVLCYSGQLATVSNKKVVTTVQDYRMIQEAAGGRRYEPVSNDVSSGYSLKLRAHGDPDDKYVGILAECVVDKLRGIDRIAWPGRPEGSNLVVDRPTIDSTRLESHFGIPTDQVLLMGGMPSPETLAGALDPPPADTQRVYFLISARTVQTPGAAR